MTQKLAVIVIHGLGRQKPDFAKDFITNLHEGFRKVSGEEHTESRLVIQPVHWAKVFQDGEKLLEKNLFYEPYHLRYLDLRRIVVHYLADAVAYQPLLPLDEEQNYTAVHRTIFDALQVLAQEAGPNAPLCVISHSLGTVVASNFFYDLQSGRVIANAGFDSALERGDTLSLFYSCGTTLPLWSLRYHDFDQPIRVPSQQVSSLYPNIKGGWINFFDKDDILAYPLRKVHPEYEKAVTEDRDVNVGDIRTNWNPFSHSGYFKSDEVTMAIVKGMVKVWKEANQSSR
ncbi:chemotaxis protein [Paenibacillus peoriae]|uniref:hypothetical protein n=1 Tax=Paenibacillus peoriae TaxID=59893 RepID=UPI00026C6147|nr:hypothetical protein [Paenibacillus peoriae]MEC0184743.1 chemotaxis protein [Paenibacillus peoriae]